MGDMRVSMLVEMKAAAARAEAAGLRGDIEKLSTSATAAGQATGRAAGGVTQLATASTASASAVTQQTTALQQMIAVSTGLASATQSSVAAELAHGRALDETRARFDPLFAASRRYEMELLAIADAERDGALTATGAAQARARAAQSMAPMLQGVSKNAGTAAQSVAQLGFQFNDIGVMLAAGQNPLMLAIQQGTQITQVFDNMKAKGEPVGKSLKAALLGMLSPMNLVTMGAIAMGAVVVSALVGMIGETKTADEAIGDLTKSAGAFSQVAGRSVGDVTKEFGGLNIEIVRMQENLTALARIKAIQDLGTAAGALQTDLSAGWLSTQKDNIGDLLGSKKQFAGPRQGMAYSDNDPAIRQMQTALENLAAAKGPREQLAAVQALKAEIVGAAGSIGQMTGAQVDYYGKLLETEAAINRISAAEAEANRQRIEMQRAAGIENDRMGGPTALDRLPRDPVAEARARLTADAARKSAAESIAAAERENALAEAKLRYGAQSVQVREVEAQQIRAAVEAEIQRLNIARQGDQAKAMRAAADQQIALIERQRQDAAQKAATTMLADLQQEAELVKLTAKYGADSLEVAYARAGAEREAQVALLASQGIAGTQAKELMQAWDAARGIASVNMAAGIGAASAQAQMLAANLGISLQHAIGLLGLASKRPTAVTGTSRYTFGGVGSVGVNGSGGLGFGDLSSLPGRYEPPAITAASTPKAGGGGGGKKAETNSVLELIRAEERELAVLRETDPVKRELLEKSEQLKGATTAQKTELEALIRTRIAEKTALDAIKEAQEELKSTMKSAFVGWVTGANSFRDALSQVLGKLAEMAASSAFDMLWGGGGGGGGFLGNLLGGVFGGGASSGGTGSLGLPMPFADGGRIAGNGGPREDNHLVRVSSGEYIVNAAATANALPLLEAINAGVPLDKLIGEIAGTRPMAAFADGGRVGSAPVGYAAPASWQAGGDRSGAAGPAVYHITNYQTIHVDGATGNTEIREMVAEGVRAGQELFDREVLPGRVLEVLSNDRVSGR